MAVFCCTNVEDLLIHHQGFGVLEVDVADLLAEGLEIVFEPSEEEGGSRGSDGGPDEEPQEAAREASAGDRATRDPAISCLGGHSDPARPHPSPPWGRGSG